MRREDVQKGLYVRLVANYLDVPCGTLATVETVGMLAAKTIVLVKEKPPTLPAIQQREQLTLPFGDL